MSVIKFDSIMHAGAYVYRKYTANQQYLIQKALEATDEVMALDFVISADEVPPHGTFQQAWYINVAMRYLGMYEYFGTVDFNDYDSPNWPDVADRIHSLAFRRALDKMQEVSINRCAYENTAGCELTAPDGVFIYFNRDRHAHGILYISDGVDTITITDDDDQLAEALGFGYLGMNDGPAIRAH